MIYDGKKEAFKFIRDCISYDFLKYLREAYN